MAAILFNKRYILLSALSIIGVLVITFYSFNYWLALLLTLGVAFCIPFFISALKYPEFIVFLSILLNFTPLNRNTGFYFILLLAIIHFSKNILIGRPLFKIDKILTIWFSFMVMILITFVKWVNIYRGLRGSLSMIIIPMLLYILFNHGYISKKGTEKFLTTYFPLVYTYIIIQLLLTVIKGTAISGYSFQEFHTGFDLGWGKSVFVAALTMFLLMLTYQTRNYWHNRFIIKSLIYFNFIVSIVVIILIMARAPFVSLFATLMIYYLYNKLFRKTYKKINYLNLLYGILLIIPLYYVFNKFIYYLATRFIHMKTDPSFLVRVYMYYDGFIAYINNIIIGVGPEQHMFKDFLNYVADPNNILISYAVSFGSVGLLLIIALFLMPYITMARLYKVGDNKKIKYLGAMLIPVLTMAIFNSLFEVIITSFCYGTMFWTVYAIFYRLHDVKLDILS
ncbi:MAG: O-antigen ligase family protein [Candidatus Edwardsbacteria bacterium]|nr:O-antigen ligase family protein [Candidatus Edwardsbacteria bacterium]